ncbi:MAG: heavy metal translocating P-type ATPase [Alphaproteobacteria bacterium]
MENIPISDTPYIHHEIESNAKGTGYECLAIACDNGGFRLSILVNGVYCAACIQKIESALSREENVTHVRLNFGAKRLLIEWKGPPARANDYVEIIEGLGYNVQPYDARNAENSANAEERFLLLCLGVAGFAMGNVMLLSVGVWSTSAETMGIATRDLFHWISAFIALPTILFSGRPFFRSALNILSKGHTNMDVPISIALFLAGGMSLFETINHGEHVYFDSAVMLIFFLLIGRYLDFRARKNARGAAHDLLKSFSGFANVVDGNKTSRVLIRDLEEGMVLRISAGENFPVDGIIMNGSSTVDTSLVTGETLPVSIKANSNAYAGTLNIDAPITMRVTKAAENSLLADIVRLMDKAQQGQAAYVRIADRAAKLYTPVVHIMAVLAFFGWIFIGGIEWQSALMISITVLIITCPCALGLAVPVVQVLANNRLMKSGVLVKSGDALERLAKIDTIMLDKTGTLTLGVLKLIGTYERKALQIAASLAINSSHPLSQALCTKYEGELLKILATQEHAGQGLEGIHNGATIKLGSRSFCGDENAPPSDKIELWLDDGSGHLTCFYFQDVLRPDSPEVISQFKKADIRPILVSGDRDVIVQDIANQTRIDGTYAQQTPPQKFNILTELKSNGHRILMVGDGLNDAPVLAGADVSIAPGTAIDMAQNAADIIFMGDNFKPVYDVYETARMTQKLVRQNFALAILYNIIAIPLALSGAVTPLIAALAMSGSSLLVVANSFRLGLRP